MRTNEKCERAVIANERKTAGERRGERVTIPQSTHNLVCNTAVLGSSRNALKNGCVTDYPLPWPLPEKPFSCQNVKCQNVQRCGVGGFHQLNLFVRHCEREVNCHNLPIRRYTKSCAYSFHAVLIATFPYPLSSLSWSLEQVRF